MYNKCEYCGKHFRKFESPHVKFCSDKCYKRHKREQRKGPLKPIKKDLT